MIGVPQPRASWSRGQQWLTVVATFLLGICLASAVFVLVWSREASRADSTEAALARVAAERRQALASAERLERSLARSESALAATRRTLRRQQSIAKAMATTASAVAADGGRADEATRRIAARAGSVAGGAGRVISAVAAIETYVSKTPAGEIDPAYLAAQLDYLDTATRALRADGAAVGAEADKLRQTRLGLSRRIDRLRALAGRLDRAR